VPRKPRLVAPAYPHHVIQRGNNRQAIFFAEDDYRYYLNCLQKAKVKGTTKIYAYVLMTNHAHLLIEPAGPGGLGEFMQSVGRRYVRYINKTYRRTGTLWEGRYKSAIVGRDEYLMMCSRYIEMNPVRAGMVQMPGDYRWTSYRFRALGEANRLLDEDPWYEGLGKDRPERCQAYRGWMESDPGAGEWDAIRDATQKGQVIGKKKFQDEIEAMLGHRISGQRGRPRKERLPNAEIVL
jgi:REP-associated tyrosine transposase